MLQYTPKHHKDYIGILSALREIRQSYEGIKLFIQQQENDDFISRLQLKFVHNPGILQPGRYFIRQGILWRETPQKDKRYTFFLFNNILICAKPLSVFGS